MSYDNPGAGALDYFPCRYGASKLLLRGPRRRLDGDYVAFLGGSETYGRFVPEPYPALFERLTGLKAVNLGCVNAGVDAYLTDKTLLDICRKARVTVIQLMGAQNMSNRCYRVHPRRNDRFLKASSLLTTVYRDVDFNEFNFTRHMLRKLEQHSEESFVMVRKELKEAWVARMGKLIDAIGGQIVLMWMSDHPPQDVDLFGVSGTDPLFVDRKMLRGVAGGAARAVQIVATADEIIAGQKQLVYPPMERAAAEEMLGPLVHQRAARDLAEVVPVLL